MKVGYVAPLSATGYSQAARSYIHALHLQGVNLSVYISSEDPSKDFGYEGELMRELSYNARSPEDCDIVIHQREPGFIEWVKGAKNVCYTVFETNRIPHRWVYILNDDADDVWVPSQFNVDVFQSSGVKTPVYKVPHIVDVERFNRKRDPILVDPRDFAKRKILLFIGPWDNRKNPEALVRAYYNAFSAEDDVILVLRSYAGMHSVTPPVPAINTLRSESGHSRPPIAFFAAKLPDEDIDYLHQNALLYASMSHSEGWGLNHSQSLACGVPVLSVRWGGSLEFQNDDNSFLVNPGGLTPTVGFSTNSIYDPSRMHWATVDGEHATKLLWQAANDPELCRQKGKAGKKWVTNHYNHQVIGNLMIDRLEGLLTGNIQAQN